MERRVRPRSRRFAFLSLAVVATGVAVLLLEVGVRAFLPHWAPRTARMTAFWQYHPRYGWEHIPNTSGRFASVGFDVAVRLNAKGFRGPDVSYSREGAGRRVVVLGDSHVWGFGVEEEATFCRQIERMLPGVEVINLGVSGYSTDQELLLYQDEGHRYGGDIVVLVVAHNDLRGNTRTIESSIYGKPRFLVERDELVLDNHPVPRPSWLKRGAFDASARSYLLTRALRIADGFRRAADVSSRAAAASQGVPEPKGRQAPFPWTPTEKVMARLLVEMDRTVSRLQPEATFLVVFADLREGIGVQATEYLDRFGIRSIALDPHIDPMDPAWHLPDGLHWTEAGHARVAGILGEELRRMLGDEEPSVETAVPNGLNR